MPDLLRSYRFSYRLITAMNEQAVAMLVATYPSTLIGIDNHLKGFVGPVRGSSGGLCPPDPLEFIAFRAIAGQECQTGKAGPP